ncbi:hypothetical protein FI667_g16005, partial [Globisporangium splendens]
MDAETFAKWKTATQSGEVETVKAEVLERYPAVVEKLTELVPSAIDAETFWIPYIYKASLLVAQEQRGADLLFFVGRCRCHHDVIAARRHRDTARWECKIVSFKFFGENIHRRVLRCYGIRVGQRSPTLPELLIVNETVTGDASAVIPASIVDHWRHLDHAGALEHVLRRLFDHDDTAVILNDRLRASDCEQHGYFGLHIRSTISVSMVTFV